jgi:hypothetical protein
MIFQRYLLLLAAPAVFGQTLLQVVPGTATPGGAGSAEITINSSSSSDEPSALEWTLTYSSTALNSVALTAGPALSSAGKSLSCLTATGQIQCVVWGENDTPIANGVLETASFMVSSPAPPSTPLGLTGLTAVSGAGMGMSATGTGATLTMTPSDPIVSLTCGSSVLVTPSSTVCTATLQSQPTVPTKIELGLASGSAKVSIGSCITVPINSRSATFTVKAGAVTANETAVVVATLNGVTESFSITLEP